MASIFDYIRQANEQLTGMLLLPDDHLVVLRRRQQCAACPDRFEVPWDRLKPLRIPPEYREHCKRCLCNIKLKTRAEWSRCPAGKW